MRSGTEPLSRAGLRRVLAVLCGTLIVSWGVLYYAFPVLATAITADTGWPLSTITAAFSTGLVVSAVAGIPAGRLIDRYGPRVVMTTGSVLGAPAVVGIGLAPTLPWFFAAWVLAGVAMAGTLYAPAFTALTRWWGERRVTALTAATLFAGFASVVFAPVTAVLLEASDWRRTYLVLAVVLAATTIPAHLFGLRGHWPAPDPVAPSMVADPGAIARSRPFVLAVLAVGLGSFTAFAVIVNQVPLLMERGLSTTAAAWALGLGGLGQVLGRLGYRWLVDVTSVRARGVAILLATAVTTAFMALVPGPAWLLVVLGMLAGAARGVLTLFQATAVSDRWGSAHYGRLNGILSAPVMLATALAPWAGAALADVLGGYPAVFVVLAGVSVLAAVCAWGSVPAGSVRDAPLRT